MNADRLWRRLMSLAEIGATPDGGTSRVAYSDLDREARGFVMEMMGEAGLSVRIDPAANIIGSRPGRDPSLPPIVSGSHIDSVPDGGRFDGQLGVMAAIEIAHSWNDQGIETRHPYDVVIFANEEGGLQGSRALTGSLPRAELNRVTQSGRTMADGIRFLGGDPERLFDQPPPTWRAYLELHIEQGTVLEECNTPIGIVGGFVGIRQDRMRIRGEAGHAGTTSMDRRRDALVTAAQVILEVRRAATERDGSQVATVGQIEARPGAANVVPGEVDLTVEVRDLDAQVVDAVAEEIAGAARRIAVAAGTELSVASLFALQPTATDPAVRDALARAAGSLDLAVRSMASGAGHDAQYVTKIAPSGLVFVPSAGGISHSPREFTEPGHAAAGGEVLEKAMLTIDRG